MTDPEDAATLLQRAMALHGAGDIDEALATAERAVAASPGFAAAHAYLGNTLVTRKRRFAAGLAAMQRASSLAPDDPGILYTLGWCQEFVANALERPRGRPQPVDETPEALYAAAHDVLLQALTLDPEAGLRADIEDILDVIAAVTGVPWEQATAAAGSGEPS